MYKNLRKTLVMLIVLSTSSMSLAQQAPKLSVEQAIQSKQVAQANEDVQKEALRLMVFSSLLSDKIAKMDKIPANVEKRYETIRNAYFGSIPGSLVAGGFVALTVAASKKVEFVWSGLTVIFRAMGQVLTASSEAIDNVATALYNVPSVKFVVDSLGNSLRNGIELLVNIVKPFVFKGSGTLTGSSSLGTILAGSIYLATHNVSEALNNDTARRLLGYDKAVQKNLGQLVEEVAVVFNLNASEASQFKKALSNEAINQAVKNQFNKDASAYSIDVLQVLSTSGLATAEQVAFVSTLTKAYDVARSAKRISTAEELEILRDNIDNVAALSAILAELSNSEVVNDPAMRAEIDRLLGSVTAKMQLAMGRLASY